MNLEQLRKSWVSQADPEIQARIWDRSAEHYRSRPLPDPGEDAFLRRLRHAQPDLAGKRILDVGCGAGGYSLALARLGARTMGVDISPKMIEYACERAREEQMDSSAFRCLNWADADIDALGFRAAFDVAFAHMTPAVADFDTFDRLNACSRGLCAVEKPTRRRDQVMDAAFARAGLERERRDEDMEAIFSYLWNRGYRPEFFYSPDLWRTERTVEEMEAWCVDRASLRQTLTEGQEASIRAYIRDSAVDGKVMETTHTTRVTVIWRVDGK